MRVNTISELSYNTYIQENTTPDPALTAPLVIPAIISLVGGPDNIYMTTPAYEGMSAGDVITPVVGGGSGASHTVLAEEAGQPLTFSIPSGMLATQGLAVGDQVPFAYMVEGANYPQGVISLSLSVRVVASIINDFLPPKLFNTYHSYLFSTQSNSLTLGDNIIYSYTGETELDKIDSAYLHIIIGNNEYAFSTKLIFLPSPNGGFVTNVAVPADKIIAGNPKNRDISIFYSINTSPGDTASPAMSQPLLLTMNQQPPAAAPEIIGKDILDYYWGQNIAPTNIGSSQTPLPNACVYVKIPAYPGMAFGDRVVVMIGPPGPDGTSDRFTMSILIIEDQVGRDILMPVALFKELYTMNFKKYGSTLSVYYTSRPLNGAAIASDVYMYNAPK